MDPTTFRADERAVPPVIGVILMVAIVVVLSAIVTSYVFGLGVFGFETVPQAQFSGDFNDGATVSGDGCNPGGGTTDGVLNVTHNGGQTLDADTISVKVAGSSAVSWADCSGADTEIENQDSAHIAVNDTDTVRIVWESKNEENSHTMFRWNGTAET